MKILDSYNKIPDAQRGAVDKFALPATVALATLAVLVAGGNIVKNKVADTMEKNMGDSVYEQVTGENKSQDVSEQLDIGLVIIDKSVFDAEKPSHR